MPQPLSSKDSSLFRALIRNYEEKQYKKGLKTADQILKKNPKHGETLAMKAMIINSLGRTDEAFALGKEALQYDMKSHVCWHVYGLIYRANNNYEEAAKAYKFALRLEPESQQIQRDLAVVQVHMRDYQGHVASRRLMLKSRSHVRQSWTALAVAHHLAGDLKEAEHVLTSYESTLKNPPSKTDFEHSEAIMYKNQIIAETGDIARALEHLEKDAKNNLDRLAVMERRAEYLTKLERKDEAIKAWRALIERNPDHKDYYESLAAALDFKNDPKALKAVYDEYAEKFPKSDAARRLPLDFLEGDDFKQAVEQYIHRMLDKGIPSLFANLKALYSNEFKKETIFAVVQEYIKTKGETNGAASKGDTEVTAAYYFLAQHYNYYLSRDLAKALEYVEKAIERNPKSVDFFMTKARIWKHYGNVAKAAQIMDQARELDRADRYINTKTAKYQLRNNESEKALKTVGLFTRAETVGGPLADLQDMQGVWFLTEDAESYARQNNIGLALKRFTNVYTIFNTWYEDQLDFHTFSFRRGAIRAYIDLLRWEDKLREHPYYTRAALGAIDVYIKMYDNKPKANGVNGHSETPEEIAAAKKAAKKAKKEAEKAAEAAAAKKNEPNQKDIDGQVKKPDDDPDGAKLAATEDPLKEALKFLEPILEFSPKNIAGQLAGFEVYIRRDKLLLALKCLLAAAALEPENPTVHEQIIRFKQAYDAAAELPAEVKETVKDQFNLLPESKSLSQFNDEYLSKHSQSASHVLSGIVGKKLLGASPDSLQQEVIATLELPNASITEAEKGLKILASWQGSDVSAYKQKASAKWPEATVFQATA